MKKIVLVFLLSVLVIAPVFVDAQTPQGSGGPPPQGSGGPATAIPNPLSGVNSIGDFFYQIVDFVMSLSYVVIAFFLLLSGFKFVTAQGSEDKLTDAKKTFMYTIIGALILIGANTIVAVVKDILTKLNS